MRKESVLEFGFLLLLFLMAAGWVGIHVSGFRAEENSRRILDIELEMHPAGHAGVDICTMLIRNDDEVDYSITKPLSGEPLLICAANARVAPGVGEQALSNDLIEKVWIQSRSSDFVTVGVALASSEVQISDWVVSEPNWGIAINLEPWSRERRAAGIESSVTRIAALVSASARR